MSAPATRPSARREATTTIWFYACLIGGILSALIAANWFIGFSCTGSAGNLLGALILGGLAIWLGYQAYQQAQALNRQAEARRSYDRRHGTFQDLPKTRSRQDIFEDARTWRAYGRGLKNALITAAIAGLVGALAQYYSADPAHPPFLAHVGNWIAVIALAVAAVFAALAVMAAVRPPQPRHPRRR